jgi:hypothetical protein
VWLAAAVLAAAAGIFAIRDAAAQDEQAAEPLSPTELAELVGPIALYPDDLVAIVLPASTYPLQVVEAARFLDARTKDSKLEPESDWDDSIVALLNYPEVVRLMNDDLDWTYDLGEAVLNQRPDVLDAIQGFRERAANAGNLRSDERQTIAKATDGTIEIKPADPEVIYVPYYEPERVVVYQTVPVYHYYPWSYPVYYYPYPAGYTFSTGWFWGVTSWFSIGWDSHLVHVHHYGYRGHPYFGWNYYNPFYVRRDVHVNVHLHDRGGLEVWQPRYRYGGRPLVRGRDGYVSAPAPRVSRGASSSEGYRNRAAGGTVARSRVDGGTAGGVYRNRAENGTVGGSAYRNRGTGRAESALGTERTAPGNRSANGGDATRISPPRASAGNAPNERSPLGNRGRPSSSFAAPTPGASAAPGANRGIERYRGRTQQPQEAGRTAAPARAAPPSRGDNRPGGYGNAQPRPRFEGSAPPSGRSLGGNVGRAPESRAAPNAGGYRGGGASSGAGAARGSGGSYRGGAASGGYRGGQGNGGSRGEGRGPQR